MAKAKSQENKKDRLEVRLENGEKEAFDHCAEMSGVSLSIWVRERLRRVARKELEEANKAVPFLRNRF
jgi:uncharacterized protein (DUF1778 family)